MLFSKLMSPVIQTFTVSQKVHQHVHCLSGATSVINQLYTIIFLSSMCKKHDSRLSCLHISHKLTNCSNGLWTVYSLSIKLLKHATPPDLVSALYSYTWRAYSNKSQHYFTPSPPLRTKRSIWMTLKMFNTNTHSHRVLFRLIFKLCYHMYLINISLEKNICNRLFFEKSLLYCTLGCIMFLYDFFLLICACWPQS